MGGGLEKDKAAHKLGSSRTPCLKLLPNSRKEGSKNVLEASNKRQGRQSQECIVIPLILERKAETAPPETSSILALTPTVQCSAVGGGGGTSGNSDKQPLPICCFIIVLDL